MGEIYRDSLVPAEKAKEGQVKEGWIDASLGLGVTKPSPFGACAGAARGLWQRPEGLPIITHYRWSYRPLGSVSDAIGLSWTISRRAARSRATIARRRRPMSPVIYKSVQIGPDTTVPGYYTIIDPVLPAGGEDWEVLDEGYDLASAYFNTTLLADGKYELKMELFRKVGAAMVRVDLTAEGVELYEITDPAPLVEGSYTTTAAVERSGADRQRTGHVVGYRLVVHVDNRVCFGNIEDVTVNGVPAGRCGFLEYNNLTDNCAHRVPGQPPRQLRVVPLPRGAGGDGHQRSVGQRPGRRRQCQRLQSRGRHVQQRPDDQHVDDERSGRR